jgi:hypothetical protein
MSPTISSSHQHELSYVIELKVDDGNPVERVLARAVNLRLAREIFKAAQTEHPDRRITLRKGNAVVEETSR